jgi:phosphoenolpyruvate synthase/pyruvate phosphate dikinase
MQIRLSLSGETPPAWLVDQFDGVGLIRSEYVLRRHNQFITRPEVQRRLAEYVAEVARLCAPAPVWYRTSEMTTQEANTLDGVDRRYDEADFMKGRRGVRRALELPDAMEVELRVLAEVATQHPNLHLVLPFVRDADDFGFVLGLLERVEWPNRFGSMVEIPSALLEAEKLVAMGATNLMLGLNDLSSLLTGTSRQDEDMKLHGSVWWAVRTLAQLIGTTAEWGIAGNLTNAVLEEARAAGVPYASIHYSELPNLRGTPPDMLPDIEMVAEVKAFTRAQIEAAERRRYVDLAPC